jgi:hypothetical protein
MLPYFKRLALVVIAFAGLFSTSAGAWEVTPTALSGTESQSVTFHVVIDAEEWEPAGGVCNDAVWEFEFPLSGTLVDGSAEWGVDLSSPFAGGALSGICSNSEADLITPYTIAMIEDFIPENTEDAEIFFEYCEAEGRGEVECTEQTLAIEVVEVAGGGLPEVGVLKVKDAIEPNINGRFRFFLEAPAPNGGVLIGVHTAGTASPGNDYVALPPTVFIPEGATEAFVDVQVIDDGLLEGTESVMVTLLLDPNYTIGFQLARATVLIEDNDGDATVVINQGISDAWFNTATPGQGFFIIVFPEIGKVFLAWFTYDTERPPANVEAILGDPGHRWLTALGDYAGNMAVLDVELSEGGVFNTVPPEVIQSEYGTITLEFIDCNTGLVHFNIPSLSLSDTVPIQRLTLDNVGLCEEQNAGS